MPGVPIAADDCQAEPVIGSAPVHPHGYYVGTLKDLLRRKLGVGSPFPRAGGSLRADFGLPLRLRPEVR